MLLHDFLFNFHKSLQENEQIVQTFKKPLLFIPFPQLMINPLLLKVFSRSKDDHVDNHHFSDFLGNNPSNPQCI